MQSLRLLSLVVATAAYATPQEATPPVFLRTAGILSVILSTVPDVGVGPIAGTAMTGFTRTASALLMHSASDQVIEGELARRRQQKDHHASSEPPVPRCRESGLLQAGAC